MIFPLRRLLHRITFISRRIAAVVLLFVLAISTLPAQELVEADTLALEGKVKPEEVEPHSAVKATMYALVLPGLGQAYNHKYYKIPFVYAAFAGAGYAIWLNHKYYLLAVDQYRESQDSDNERVLRYWRRNLEISYIATVAVYGLQVIDAYVDAQLFFWDVSRDLSMQVAPSVSPIFTPGVGNSGSFGLTCSFSF